MTNVAVVVPPVFMIGVILFAVLTALALILSVVMMRQVDKIPDSLGLRWGLWQPAHRGVTVGQMIYRVRFDAERYPGVVRLQTALRIIHAAVAALVLAFLTCQLYAAFTAPA